MTQNVGDELNISDGGVLTVDTERFRSVHERLLPLSSMLSGVAADLAAAKWATLRAEQPVHLDLVCVNVQRLAEEIAITSQRLGHMIDVFEIVEARLSGQVIVTQGPTAHSWLSLGSDRTGVLSTPVQQADALIAQWRQDSSRGFLESVQWAWLLGAQVGGTVAGFALTYPGLVTALSRGVVPGQAPLKPVDHTVDVGAVALTAPTSPPKNLVDVTERFPDSEGAQVRVEKYTMEDGTTQYGVYIAGTDWNPDSPWNMESNTDLYMGQEESASYDAVKEALAQAGVSADAPVHLFTHSQGAMIGGHLAASGEFNVVTHASFGSPVDVEAPSTVTNYVVRHTNEPVALMAGGGSPSGSGSEDSLTFDRIGEPGAEPLNPLGTHLLDSYRITAKLIDESDDPRLLPMRDLFAGLGQAKSIEATDYVAKI